MRTTGVTSYCVIQKVIFFYILVKHFLGSAFAKVIAVFE